MHADIETRREKEERRGDPISKREPGFELDATWTRPWAAICEGNSFAHLLIKLEKVRDAPCDEDDLCEALRTDTVCLP